MKFFILGSELMGTALAFRLSEIEGHDVRVFSEKKEGKQHLVGMVRHVDSLEEGLRWVGRDGYIIRDDENDVTPLRGMGFKVYGGNKFTERMERDRVFEMEVAKEAGIKIPNFHPITTPEEAIRFIKRKPDAYALKQLGNLPKEFSFVGKDEDGRDMILQLEWIAQSPLYQKLKGKGSFILQEVVDGIEFASSAWWMGSDWKRDDDGNVVVEINREHKKMLNGDLGISCGEMGTVGLVTNEYTRLFEETVDKLTPILREKAPDVIVNVDANCGIVDDGKDGVPYLFEITPREGYPFQSLMMHLFSSQTLTGEFFSDLIDKKQGNVGWSYNWGVVTTIGTGDYPHESLGKADDDSFIEQPVRFHDMENWNPHIHPGYISYDSEEDVYRVADDYALVACVTFDDPIIQNANRSCVETMRRIDVRSPVFRTDIGDEFVTSGKLQKLIDWGYAPPLHELQEWQQVVEREYARTG